MIESEAGPLRLSSVRRLLREHSIKPRKGLGQNFLLSERLLAAIIAAAELDGKDTVLEVGAGLGALTRRLAQSCGRVVAVEVDGRLLPLLREALAPFSSVQVVHGDILALEPGDLVTPPYKVVANLPYYITSAILRYFLEARAKPSLMVVTVQQEVAQRIVAGPGQMSLLAVSVQFYGCPRIVAKAPAGAFYPSPGVISAVLRVDLYESPPVEVADVERFFEIVRAGFSQRRKQLRNSLSQGLHLPVDIVVKALRRVGLQETQRAQELSIDQWARLLRELP
jgi:16S rRNA (adenine1518-N6/adenine1519-N6)-dimethyltransferase